MSQGEGGGGGEEGEVHLGLPCGLRKAKKCWKHFKICADTTKPLSIFVGKSQPQKSGSGLCSSIGRLAELCASLTLKFCWNIVKQKTLIGIGGVNNFSTGFWLGSMGCILTIKMSGKILNSCFIHLSLQLNAP